MWIWQKGQLSQIYTINQFLKMDLKGLYILKCINLSLIIYLMKEQKLALDYGDDRIFVAMMGTISAV